MRFIPGLVVALILFGGLAVVRLGGDTPTVPDDDFLRLELTGAPPALEPSCYSLQATLVATRFFEQNSVSKWRPVWKAANGRTARPQYWWDLLLHRKREPLYWEWTLESVIAGPSGPEHQWRVFDFERRGDRIVPTALRSSAGDRLPLEKAMEELLSSPKATRARKVERCQ